MDVNVLNAELPPTDNPKFDRVRAIWTRGEDEPGYRKAAADAGFAAELVEQGEIIRYWQPLHSSKEAFIYHHWDLFDGARKLIANQVEAEDTGSEPD
jgi:hypothetical protein